MLTERQLEIVTGSLLGDGTIWTNFVDPLCKFQLTQSKLDCRGMDKKSYFSWWVNEFMSLGCSVKPRTTKGTGILKNGKLYYQYVFSTKCNRLWNELESKWYKPIVHRYWRRKKFIPADLKLTPLTLCVWFMEDGSNYAKDGNLTLETQGFTEQEVDFLINRLDIDLGINASKKKANKKNQFRIYIGVESFHKFIEIIRPHVAWNCFQYKLNNSYNKVHQSGENHSQAKLTDEQAREMIALRKNGQPVAVIAEKFKTSTANVSMITSGIRWKHLGESVEVKRKPHVTAEMREQIFALSKTGLSQKEIAALLNINRSTISRTLKGKNEKLLVG